MHAQIREVRMDYREATGPCKARALAQRLWAGEEYFLQIDSHMRFSPGWDAQLVQWLRQAEASSASGRAVLSTYPPSYEVCSYSRIISKDNAGRITSSAETRAQGPIRARSVHHHVVHVLQCQHSCYPSPSGGAARLLRARARQRPSRRTTGRCCCARAALARRACCA